MVMEQWGLPQHKTKWMFQLLVGNGQWENQRRENFQVLNAKFLVGLRLIQDLNPCKQKAAPNYSNAALARVEALENGYDEAIMLNWQGKVAEGSAENIFVVKDDVIQTPPLSAGGLEGITRDSVIQIIEENGGFVIERDLERDDLYNADEIFMTGTAAEVKSVTQVDKVKIGNGKMGKITKALQKSFTDVVMAHDERFLPWLTFL